MSFDPLHRFAVFEAPVDDNATQLSLRNYVFSSDDYIQALAFFSSYTTTARLRLGIVERTGGNDGGIEIDVDYFQGLEEVFARMNECRVTLMMPANPGKSTWPLLPQGIHEHLGVDATAAQLVAVSDQLVGQFA